LKPATVHFDGKWELEERALYVGLFLLRSTSLESGFGRGKAKGRTRIGKQSGEFRDRHEENDSARPWK